jgi:hypothetical protein
MTSGLPSLLDALFGKQSLEEVSAEELYSVVQEFPSFNAARFLLSKKLKQEHDPAYEEETRKTALYFDNPVWLQWLLENDLSETYGKPAAAGEDPGIAASWLAAEPAGQVEPGGVTIMEYSHEEIFIEELDTEEELQTAAAGTGWLDPAETGEQHTEPSGSYEPDAEPETGSGASGTAAYAAAESLADGRPVPADGFFTESRPASGEAQEGNPPASFYETPGQDPASFHGPLEEQHSVLPEEISAVSGTELQEEYADPSSEIREPYSPADAYEAQGEEPQVSFQEAEAEMQEREEQSSPFREITAESPVHEPSGEGVPALEASEESTAAPAGEAGAQSGDQPVPHRAADEIPFDPGKTESIVFAPYHVIDYFASQGIKLELEDQPADQFGKQLKRFTDWLKVMKRLPARQLAPEKTDERETERIRRFAASSIEERDILTETMAEVLVKQGMYENAIALYQKLSLIYPPKSAYFASRIEQLKASLP